MASTRSGFVRVTVALVCVMGVSAVSRARVAAAQQPSRTALEFSAGLVGFPDDGYLVREGMAGATGRLYLRPRLAIGPEVVFIAGQRHSHVVVTGNATFDLRAPAGAQVRRVTPFLVAGGGFFQTRGQLFNGPYTHTEGAFTLGGGMRARAGERGTIGIEARLGWEAHIRVNALVGWRIGP